MYPRTAVRSASTLAPALSHGQIRLMSEQRHIWRIDGIEDEVARIEEDGERVIGLPRHLLPVGAREGQRLVVTRAATGQGNVTLTIALDEAGTAAELAKSKAQTSAMLAQSKKRDPGGNVAL